MKNLYKGYLVVASKEYVYYAWAINLLEQIKDYNPDAKVCLVTEERFVDSRAEIADHIVYCGNHYREKLWGMSQSPFDLTFYMDADMECLHEDIATVFDLLGESDMTFTELREECYHIFKDIYFPGGKFTLCGGVCLYNSSNPLVKEFMTDWFDIYDKQRKGKWWPLDENGEFDKERYPYHLRHWDQFTLWWLLNENPKYKDIKLKLFDEEIRWNWYQVFADKENYTGKDIIIYHMSGMEIKRN